MVDKVPKTPLYFGAEKMLEEEATGAGFGNLEDRLEEGLVLIDEM